MKGVRSGCLFTYTGLGQRGRGGWERSGTREWLLDIPNPSWSGLRIYEILNQRLKTLNPFFFLELKGPTGPPLVTLPQTAYVGGP